MLSINQEYGKYVMQFKTIEEIDEELDRLTRNLENVRNGKYSLILCRKKISLYNYRLMLPQIIIERHYEKIRQNIRQGLKKGD